MKARLGFRLLVLYVIAALLGNMGLPAAQAQNGAPTVVSYQGQILVGGTAYTGSGYFKFAVVDAAGTTSYWSNDGSSSGGGEPAAAVQLAVSGGLFNVLLGDTGLTNMTALPASAFSGTDRRLRVWFSSDGSNFVQLSPDRRIAAVPYALQAQEAQQAFNAWTLNGVAGSGYQQRVSGTCATGSAIRVVNTDGTVTCQAVGGGADWSLTGNAGTTPGTNYVGTSDNQALEIKVNAVRVLRLEPNATSPNLLGGHSGNWLAAEVYGATIGGGGTSDLPNRVTDSVGTVVGGANNQAGDDLGTAGDKPYATVVGGMDNIASGAGATVVGGDDNIASGNVTTVAGGMDNTASANYAFVGGGEHNVGSGVNAGVIGGANNVASGFDATVGGGGSNTASGTLATVPGGASNVAAGNYSFAAGRRAKANNTGCFVWADSTDADYVCSTDNLFAVRATGGITLDLDGVGSGLRLEPNANSPNLIGGYSGNWLTAGVYGATIGGGGADGFVNRVTDSGGTVGGGAGNQAGDNAGTTSDNTYATVGGGGYNTASGANSTVGGGSSNTASGDLATVGGGQINVASGNSSTAGGGELNTASSSYATVGGGELNDAMNYAATVGGGEANTASGERTTIAGGRENTASGAYASVGGGYSNDASLSYATIAGGDNNGASGSVATVGGGRANTASGNFSTVPGGASNAAAGLYAFAAGRQAKANNAGCFVWADSTAADFVCSTDNLFAVRASGGVSFTTGAAAVQVNGNTVWHAGNDGTGSGLDADLLDGQHGSAFQARVSGSCTTGNAIRVVNADGTVTCEAVGGSGWSLTGNASTTPGTNYVGTSDNQALEIKVNAIRALRLEPNATSPNLIGGYSGNWVTSGIHGATIGGGGDATYLNRVTDDDGTVGGGADNQAGDNAGTTTDQTYATVGGGGHNTASGSNATVGGGYENTASNLSSTVVGGSFNIASGQRATVAGGLSNDATALYATVGGGRNNTAGGEDATVAGGRENTASAVYSSVGGGYSNDASLSYAAVAGGDNNTASGSRASVGGGQANVASGDYSTVAGGASNAAGGAYSFAAGRQAKANNAGCFVWADSTAADFLCSTDNLFAVRATGGVDFQTGSAAFQVDGNTVWDAGNDGTGSTLDADLLDGQHASAFQVRVSGTCGTGNAIRVVNADGTVTCEAVGGSGWSLTGNAGTTPGTNYLGTSDNQALELKVNAVRALRLEPNATSPNLIGGYSGNWLTSGVFGATIGGGGTSDKLNRVTDNYGTVGGGVGNQAGDNAGTTTDKNYATVGGGQGNTASGTLATVGGGDHNTASGSNATVGGGYYSDASGFRATVGGGDGNSASNYAATVGGGESNTSSGERATVAGGRENTASAVYATVGGGMSNDASLYYATVAGGDNNTASGSRATAGGGQANVASGDYSTVPGGAGASAGLYGQMAHASGTFAAAGDAQASQVVLRRKETMTAASWYDLFLDGSAARLTIASGHTMTFDILITARTAAGESAGYRITGVIENVGGTTALIGTPITSVLGEDDTAWDAQVSADDTNDALVIQVQGNGETIRWVATVDAVEVAW